MERDLTEGVGESELGERGMIAGRVGEEQVLLVRDGTAYRAVAAACTHYGAPLIDGELVDGTIRCPWHHACFDLKTGAVLRAPALAPLARFEVQRRGDRIFVTRRTEDSVVIVGGGPAAVNVADTLRREGYAGRIVMISRESELPYDKPNLSKDFLAGHAPAEWLPLHPAAYYESQRIELMLDRIVTSIEPTAKYVALASGERVHYGALVLATGASARQLGLSGGQHVRYFRTRRDAEALVADAASARKAVVIGSSFIGLEVAASLRQMGLEVTIISPTHEPLERVLGPLVGRFIRRVHEQKGVRFRLDRSVASIEPDAVVLNDGSRVEGDLIVAGIGVTPNIELARAAGIAVGDGIIVDEYLRTSMPSVYACGDVAAWPDGDGKPVRIEHWVVAGRQGQTVAQNILGRTERFAAVPFFWSAHFDVVLAYVGHASSWDAVDIDGSLENNDATIVYSRGGRPVAVATIGRDSVSLRAEQAMERGESLTSLLYPPAHSGRR